MESPEAEWITRDSAAGTRTVLDGPTFSVTSSVTAQVTFNPPGGVFYDDLGIVNYATGLVTIADDGAYRFWAQALWGLRAGGTRQLFFSGATFGGNVMPVTVAQSVLQQVFSPPLKLGAGQQVTWDVFQNSGASIFVTPQFFVVERVG